MTKTEKRIGGHIYVAPSCNDYRTKSDAQARAVKYRAKGFKARVMLMDGVEAKRRGWYTVYLHSNNYDADCSGPNAGFYPKKHVISEPDGLDTYGWVFKKLL